MTDQTRNVELVIRAKNLSKKTLDDVRKEIEAVNAAIDAQVDASKRGQGSLKDLDAVYRRLEDAVKSLVQQQALIKQFEAQSARLKELQDRLGAASTRLRDHQAAMEAAEKVTARQTSTQVRLTKAVERAEQAVANQSKRLADLRAQGEAAGLAMGDLERAQDQLLATGRELANVNARQAQTSDLVAANMANAERAARDLAAAQAFEAKAAVAARQVAESEYSQFWLRELAKREAEERRFQQVSVQMAERAAREKAEADAFQSKAAQAAQVNRRQQAEREYAALFDAAEQRRTQAAAVAQLNEMADKATAAARGYTTLGAAGERLVQNNRALKNSLQQILDPAGAARSTLGGVEEEVNALASAIGRIEGPVQDARGQLRQLAEAQRALTTQASGIEAYQRQLQSLRDARAAFSAARGQVLQYAAAMRQAEAPTAEMESELRRLQSNLASASGQMQQQVARTRQMRSELQQAGVDTKNLAGAQERLTQAAKTSVQAVGQLSAAVKKYGNAAEDAAQDTNFFESNGRTTLSFFQRMRGELLALVAAYGGLQGAINLADQSVDAFNTKQGVQNQLALSVGNDAKAIGAEYEYIRQQADRIGIAFEGAAKGYAKFSAAATLAGRSRQEVRYVAETFMEVGRVANLTADDMNGVFKALEQIYSKGKIQAEELRGQLGDRLFGAFELAAAALKDQFPQLDKAMKDGLITSEQLVLIAEKYKETVAGQLPTAMQSLAANQARLNSAVFDFKVLIAESGFADEYGKLITKLSAFFRSDDGKKFAQDLSSLFGTVVQVLSVLLDHLDEVKLAVELAFGAKAAQLVAGLATSITSRLLPALVALQTELTATGLKGKGAAGVIQGAFGVLMAAMVGWQIGTYLSNEFAVVRKAGVVMVTALDEYFTKLQYKFKLLWAGFSGSAADALKQSFNDVVEFFQKTLRMFESGYKLAGLDDAAKSAASVAEKLGKIKLNVGGKPAELKKQLEEELAVIRQVRAEMLADIDKPAKGSTTPGAASATPRPDIATSKVVGGGGKDKEYEKLVKKRIALAEELTRALESAEAKIQRNEKLSLEQRLAAIDTEYQKVFRKIEQLSKLPGGTDMAANMKTTLQGYVELLKKQETLKYQSEQVATTEKRVNDLIALRTQLLQNVEAQRTTGGLTDKEAREQVATIDAQYVPLIREAVTETLKLLEANKAAYDPAVFELMKARLEAILPSLKKVKDELLSTRQAEDMLVSLGSDAFDQLAQSLAKGENAIDALKNSFLQFAADFLKKIALMIVQQMILNALQASPMGGAVKGLSGFVNGAVKHSGGLVGGTEGRTRSAPASWFASAPRYHTGGVAGLAPDEYPTILKKNEEVLTDDDPRNVLNGGLSGGKGGSVSAPQDVTVINTVDAESFVRQALATDSGKKLIMNVLSANRSELKTLVGR